MEGFFTKKQVQSKTRPDGKVYSCTSCGLHLHCDSPKLQYLGGFKKKILNVSSHPSKLDDVRGKTFQSKEYRLLRDAYKKVGIDLDKDCINTYSTICYSKSKPNNYQIDCCRKELMKLIRQYKPDIIVVLGLDALYSVIGNRWKKDLGTINKWRGWTIPDQDLNAWVCPVISVEDLSKKIKFDPIHELVFEQDIERIADLVGKELRMYPEPEIIDISNDLSPLNEITDGEIAFDYETTGIKPHEKGHKIVCASVAVSENKVYVFEIPDNKEKRKPFTFLLKRKSVGKIAQNMKFEDNWSNVRLKTPVNNWVWDTMLASHQLDNRQSITGLKFQTYVQFGVVDYDSEINPYLKAADSNSINTIQKAMGIPRIKKKVLEYCAYDSIYELRLANLQRPQILNNTDTEAAYNLFHQGILALAKAERAGLRIDVEYIEKATIKLEKKIKVLERKFYESAFYKEWQKSTGKRINLNSGKQLADFLYDVKKIKPAKLTESGAGSTDLEALEALNIPELDYMIQRDKLLKIKDTYLKGFEREQVRGILHPLFNLHTARTYRSSSQDPNFHNIPKRDKTAMQTVRKSIFPREGHQLFEVDYSGLEVSIAACYHKDPVMIKYLNDPDSDMHGDVAEEIFFLDKLDKSIAGHKVLRAATKNGFVFPEFYGDYYKNCAHYIATKWVKLSDNKVWKSGQGIEISEGLHVSDLLIKNGIKNINQFTEHIKDIEYKFWNKRFKVYRNWKDKWYDKYLQTGIVSFKTGFVAIGAMSRNDVINYPVQGAAFHCLLWALIHIDKELKEKQMQTRIVGQIHDSIVFDVFPDELESLWEIVQRVGTVELPKAFKWINVPLSIDAEICGVDESWASKIDFNPDTYFLPF